MPLPTLAFGTFDLPALHQEQVLLFTWRHGARNVARYERCNLCKKNFIWAGKKGPENLH